MLTSYPATTDDGLVLSTASTATATSDIDWTADDTLVAAVVAVRTLLGGLGQAVDWGLLLRLFPARGPLPALRAFWRHTLKQRRPAVDALTARFQQAYVDAYARGAVPPLDYDNVLACDWRGVVAWTLRLMRPRVPASLPPTRALLLDGTKYDLADLPSGPASTWREDFFHPQRSVWNRMQDTVAEAAVLSLGGEPGAAARAHADDTLRHTVARSWIRALCGTPPDRYPKERIKAKLLSLGHVGARVGAHVGAAGDREAEAAANQLLQTAIGQLTADRVLRRAKSRSAVGGRMYALAEAYEDRLGKLAMESKFREAYAFKAALDACFRGRAGAGADAGSHAYLLPPPDSVVADGLVLALVNLQAHGRVVVEAVDAPHIPFGFEPGNYETRKFPKHYQRFRQRVVPTARYVFNEDLLLARVAQPDNDTSADNDTLCPLPIWRDLFGVLDRAWFARLAAAVVFSLATRGASPPRQTAAHLRPVVEPFEVARLTAWAEGVGILEGRGDGPHGGSSPSEWWWLLMGQVFASLGPAETRGSSKAKGRPVGAKWREGGEATAVGQERGAGGGC